MTQIEHLVLRVPGMSTTEASDLAEEVAKRISHLLPDGVNGNIDELDIRVTMGPAMSRNSLIDTIVRQVIQKIKPAHFTLND